MYNVKLAEMAGVKQAHLPKDLNLSPVTGETIDMKHGDRVAIKVLMGDSTGATVDFTLKQSKDAAGTDKKDLSVANVYFKKVGSATIFEKVAPSVKAANYDLSADFGAEEGIVIFEVHAEDLDVNGGFSHLSIDIADSTAAKVVATEYCVLGGFKKPMYEVAL